MNASEVLPEYAGADGYYPAGYGGMPYAAVNRGRPPMHASRRFDRERLVPNPPRGLPRK